MQCGERRDCRDRRRNATGNRFQEGGGGGPLPRRISPAVKRADKCGGHLRQHRPMRLRCPPHSHHPSSLHSKRHWVRNQSRDLSAFYTRIRTLLDTTSSSNTSRCYVWLYPNHEVKGNFDQGVNAKMLQFQNKRISMKFIFIYFTYGMVKTKPLRDMWTEDLGKRLLASDASRKQSSVGKSTPKEFCHKIKSISYAYFKALSPVKAQLSATFSVSS